MIRKQESEVKAKAWLNAICNMLTVVGASQEQIKAAVNNLDFHDFEDCLQDECAVHANAYKNYKNSAVYLLHCF